MNYLVVLDAQAGELEKILSGVKTMLMKELVPAQIVVHPVNPGDSLYFLRSDEDYTIRIKATVMRVLVFTNPEDDNLSRVLKEMQPRLQLTEEQFNHWSTAQQALFVEFESAQKIPVVHVALHRFPAQSDWIAFEELNLIT